MIEVEFQHDYASVTISFAKGQRTELSESQILFLEVDSPGCIKRVESPLVDKMVRKPRVNKAMEETEE